MATVGIAGPVMLTGPEKTYKVYTKINSCKRMNICFVSELTRLDFGWICSVISDLGN